MNVPEGTAAKVAKPAVATVLKKAGLQPKGAGFTAYLRHYAQEFGGTEYDLIDILRKDGVEGYNKAIDEMRDAPDDEWFKEYDMIPAKMSGVDAKDLEEALDIIEDGRDLDYSGLGETDGFIDPESTVNYFDIADNDFNNLATSESEFRSTLGAAILEGDMNFLEIPETGRYLKANFKNIPEDIAEVIDDMISGKYRNGESFVKDVMLEQVEWEGTLMPWGTTEAW